MIEVTAKASEVVLSKPALAFVEELHRAFEPRRQELLAKRAERYRKLAAGASFDFLPETAKVRSADWKAAATPGDLQKRHVEITGPVERKMMINALNSGADVFMADFEDALSPTWSNVVQGHLNLMDAVRRTLTFTSPEGKTYKLNEKLATLLVRPRGWHLPEKHLESEGKPIAGALADFGLYFFHNARETLDRGTGPYFYLPKMESHLEARLWNDVFVLAQEKLGIPRGSVRGTVLIETLPAAFEMDEILYELRDHASGLNAGRWDYIFSLIKKLRTRKDLILPDRQQITMTVPFMRAYTELLVKTCHRREAHAMGGMAPFIPTRKNPEINEKALAQTRADKEREVADGFDGTWVAHPDLVREAPRGRAREAARRVPFEGSAQDPRRARARRVRGVPHPPRLRVARMKHETPGATQAEHKQRASPLPAALVSRFAAVVGEEYAICKPEQLRTYESDGLASFRGTPGVVVLPASTDEGVGCGKIAREAGLPRVARGSR